MIAQPKDYLSAITAVLQKAWPANRLVNVVCHGHSVPAGYFATPTVDTFNAYPHLLHRAIKQRFPYAVVNVVVTAIGGENSRQGAKRFAGEVLCHRPDVLAIDYGLNDRGIGLAPAREAWEDMIERALADCVKVILLTPTPDMTQVPSADARERETLQEHAGQIRELSAKYSIGLVDSLNAFEEYVEAGGDLTDLLSWSNHPNRAGHELVAKALLRYFPAG
jgi:lysophospholipase L1-like esterase